MCVIDIPWVYMLKPSQFRVKHQEWLNWLETNIMIYKEYGILLSSVYGVHRVLYQSSLTYGR